MVTVHQGAPLPTTVSDTKGTVYSFSANPVHDIGGRSVGVLPDWIEDRNGNKIVFHDSGNGNFYVTDTAGRTEVASSGFGNTGDTVTISGLATPYRVTWTTMSVSWPWHVVVTHDSGSSGTCSGGGTG